MTDQIKDSVNQEENIVMFGQCRISSVRAQKQMFLDE